MVNPVIADAWRSYKGLGWLRRIMHRDAPPGNIKVRYALSNMRP
jgi:hypothetical protein